jgi:hypothetical protein
MKSLKWAPQVSLQVTLGFVVLISPTWTLASDLASDSAFKFDDQEKTEFAGGSAPFFQLYSQMAGERHKEMAQRLKDDAVATLIFVSPQHHFHIA